LVLVVLIHREESLAGGHQVIKIFATVSGGVTKRAMKSISRSLDGGPKRIV
jgi:hypothetical protein